MHKVRVQATSLFGAAIAIAGCACFVLAYWAAALIQGADVVEQGRTTQITTVKSAEDNERLLSDLQQLAVDHGQRIAVAIARPDATDIYAAGTAGGTTYRGLPPTNQRIMHSLGDVPLGDPRQVYQLSGGREFHARFVEAAESHGYDVANLENHEFVYLLAGTPLAKFFGLLLLAAMALVVIAILLSSQDYATWQLYGYGYWDSARRELERSILRPLFAVLLGEIIMIALVVLISSPHSTVMLIRYLALLSMVFSIVMCAAFLACLWVVRRLSIPARLKGKLPVGESMVVVAVMFALTCISVSSFVLPAFNIVPEWKAQEAVKGEWERTSGVYRAELSGARNMEGVQDSTARLAQRVRELSARGNVVLAEYLPPDTLLGVHSPMMIFNNEGLTRSVEGTLLAQLHADAQPVPTIFVPGGGALSEDTRSRVCAQFETSQCAVRQVSGSGHPVFTWAFSEVGWMDPSIEMDPVIVVVPDDLPLSDRHVVAKLSQSHIGFVGGNIDLSDPDIANFVARLEPFDTAWAHAHRTIGREMIVYVGGAVISVLFAAGIGAAGGVFYCRLWSQNLRALRILGRSPLNVYRRAIAIDAVSFAAVLWYLWQRSSYIRSLDALPPGAATPSMIAQFSVRLPAALSSAFVPVLVSGAALVVVLVVGRRAAR
ncbi:hypothetical protein [Corynebacterium liangguodongii]|uniref:Uncharacterized protein n=1 Tax=Corynebacterium liangguodongii TaxID=2079535 RepID=A0A2S0WCJ4_9CORY|nr:hypothetical protein [Corynebacterium liangguodongii]AWB83464.1 hypothetical protein C3E79_02310 [Corynebacterium liangguodongii]PWC00447.1 hypothetical protein DF219_00645 [Corynebacterium liangguodongii]